ncbi:Putative CRISPR-associated endonuclease Cas1 [Desulfonema limicola]|uniref:CRISPR-associated endonuclease Cas1 n=1 Tax=Desulfonema limicola TaxID=45656 RepID=A0A975B816_9BACT|nr:CRISPR-associated endonuclease Cas1 [Desulfonema limicola]QTA80270.1 Putative CRISPR-associated endonuclease Cas1 [Desulfonema limicola]
MNTIYVTDNGVMLKRLSQRILLKKDGKVINEIPVLDLKRVVVFGNNQISTDLMKFLAGKGIEIAFLSMNGRFKFRVVPETSKNIYLRMAQHHHYQNPVFRISISKNIVKGKLVNQRNLLLRCQRNQPETNIKDAIDSLKTSLQELEDKASIDEIMGAEGYGSRIFFKAYGKLLYNGFKFHTREYYPPPDPVNALLSFGYMLIFNELNGLLEACGFDVFLGFLHSAKYGRESLASDMIEELRSPIVDRLVIYLINKGVIKLSQFTEKENKGIRMDEQAIKAYLSNYEKFMTASFADMKTKKQTNYREIIRGNVFKMENVLLNNTEYQPYIFYS